MKKLKLFSFALLSVLIFSLSSCSESESEETVEAIGVSLKTYIYVNNVLSEDYTAAIMKDYYNAIVGKTFYKKEKIISVADEVFKKHKTTYKGKGLSGTVTLLNTDTKETITEYTYSNFE